MVVAEQREVVKVPSGVQVTVTQGVVKVKGPKGELTRDLGNARVTITPSSGEVAVVCALARRKEKALVGTYAAHLRNMVQGVQQEWEYKMKIVYSHFPIKTKITGDTFHVDNFLGEKASRRADILPGVKVKVEGDIVVLTGADLEKVGQTAANIEQACRIRFRDPRVFQDGVYITHKPG